jgi:hypothetical protein
MTLYVSQKLLPGRPGLSEGARIAMAFVDGGLEWVDWAAEAPGYYGFADESALAAAVQDGLHGSRYALLPEIGLMVSPVKLLTLDPAELRILARAEAPAAANDPALATQLQMLLSRHGLVTMQGFAGARAQLDRLGVSASPLFQALGADELLALYAMLSFPDAGGNATLNQAAAAFAAEQARTAPEFADYYTAFLGYVTRRGAQSGAPEQQTQLATAALQTLLPLLFPVLDCPRVDGLVPPPEVAAAVQSWQRRGRWVGFSRLSEAAANLMIHSSYAGGDTRQAQQTITDYMNSWQTFLSTNPPARGLMSQDGATCLFAIEADGLRGELMLEAGGNITTRSFRRLSDPSSALADRQQPAA